MGDGVQCPTPSVDVPPLSPNLPQAKEKIILAIDEKKDPSLAVSSLVSKLRHINRADVVRVVETWQANSIDDTRPPQSTYDTSIGHKTIDGTKKIISAIEERKSSKHNIQLPTEEANCVKIRKMFSDVITDCLRRYFIEQWNLLYPGRTWMSDTISGESIVKKLSDAIIHNKDNGDMIRALKSGNEKQWDSATLLFVLLDSNLELIEDQSNTAVNASKDIEHLRYIESLFSARMSCPSDEYKDIVAQIKQMNILGENAVQEIDDIDNSPMERKMNIKRRQLEDKEKSRKIMGSRAADSLKEYQPKLEVSTEAANFIVVRDLLQKIIPKHLSIHFIKQWNDKYPDQIWQSNNSSGQDLLDKLSDVIKNTMSLEVKRALEAGSEQQWDLSTVLFVLQNSDFNLVKHYGKRGQKAKTSSSISRTEIDDLLCIEKKFFSAHTRNQSCPSEKFSDIVRKVKESASNFLSEHAQTAICEEVEELLKQNAMVKHDDDDKQSKEEVVKHDDDDKQSKEEDVTISANLSAEQENFVKIARIVLDLFPKYLRKVFKRQWDKKYPEEEWCSGKESEVLYSKLKENVKNNRGRKAEIERLKNGNDQTWDTTTLVFAILETGLGLVDPVRPLDEWSSPLRISEEIFTLRKIRNSVFGHVESMSCPSAKLLEMISNIKSSGKSIFNQEAMKEIDAIANSPIQTDAIGQLNQQWEIEKIRNEKLEQYLADIYRRVGNLEDDVEALKRDVRTIQSESEGQPIPRVWSVRVQAELGPNANYSLFC